MRDERRMRNIKSGAWIAEQRAEWLWASHLWTTDQHNRLRCLWCGWCPPTEFPLSINTIALCKKNPDVKAFLKTIGDDIAKGMRRTLVNITKLTTDDKVASNDEPRCPFCGGHADENDIVCQHCGKALHPPEQEDWLSK